MESQTNGLKGIPRFWFFFYIFEKKYNPRIFTVIVKDTRIVWRKTKKYATYTKSLLQF